MAKRQAENHRRICRTCIWILNSSDTNMLNQSSFSHRRAIWQDTGTQCSQSQSAASTQQCQSLSLCRCSCWVHRFTKFSLQLWANSSLMLSESLPSCFLLHLLLCELLCLFLLHKHHTLSGQCVFHFPGRNRNMLRVVSTSTLRSCAMFIFNVCFSIIYDLLLPKLLISRQPAQFAAHMCCEYNMVSALLPWFCHFYCDSQNLYHNFGYCSE